MKEYVSIEQIMRYVDHYSWMKGNVSDEYISGIEAVLNYIETLPRISVETVRADALMSFDLYKRIPDDLFKYVSSELAHKFATEMLNRNMIELAVRDDFISQAKVLRGTVKLVKARNTEEE